MKNFRLLASPDELQKFELVISMIATDALYNGEIERISDESQRWASTDFLEYEYSENRSRERKFRNSNTITSKCV